MTRRCCRPSMSIYHFNEYIHIQNRAIEKRLMLNVAKTKEIVFKRPNLRRYVHPPPVLQIEQKQQVKLLRVSACTHIDSVVATMNQRLYLLNQLRRQGLSMTGWTTTFLILMVARLQYALPAVDGFLTADDVSRINAVFVKALKRCLSTTVPIACDLIQMVDNTLFEAALDVKHCLHL